MTHTVSENPIVAVAFFILLKADDPVRDRNDMKD